MNANWNWLPGSDHQADGPDGPRAMPVFAGQKLVVVGGSSGMGPARPPGARADPRLRRGPEMQAATILEE